jgi:drug/metabolite transporter (DMT)-like permease
MAGVGIIFASELSGHTPAVPLLAIFVSASSACLGSVLLKRGPAQSAIGVNAVGTAIGFVVCLMLSFVAGESHVLPHRAVAIFSLLYLVVAGSLTAFVLWSWLVLHAPISRISYIAVLVPLCALALGAIVAHERMPPFSLTGAAVVLLGVGLGLRAPAARTR